MANQNISKAPIIFVNIGWTINYNGILYSDPISGGHAYIKNNNIGHELWNFQKTNSYYYGYIPRSLVPDFKNLNAKRSDISVNNVLVIWIATDPRDKLHKIVGWYKNAIIMKEPFVMKRQDYDINIESQIKAKVSDSVLLTREQRIFTVPTGRNGIKGIGQAPIWYGTKGINEQVRKYIINFENKINNAKTKKRKPSDNTKRVENTAIEHAISFYKSIEGGEWDVSSVEKDNLGWDLTAFRNNETLKIEVKGLSGTNIYAGLTPNEFKAMKSSEHRKQYVIYILTNALSSNPTPFIFYFNVLKSKKKKYIWEDQYGNELKITEKVAATLTI